MLHNVIIPLVSPWAPPVVLVKKSDSTMRFCVDYRKINEITRKDSHPPPRISEALHALGGASYFILQLNIHTKLNVRTKVDVHTKLNIHVHKT